MAISYPVDVQNTKWAILQASTGEIIARNRTWPVLDGSAIPGQDPDHIYLLQTEASQPDYDSRLFTMQSTETVDGAANTLTKTFQALPRPVQDRKVAAENVESEQFDKHFPIEKMSRETAIMIGLIYHYAIDGQAIPLRFRAFADSFKSKVISKLLKNRDRLDEILADIDNGIEPDLDSGWEPED